MQSLNFTIWHNGTSFTSFWSAAADSNCMTITHHDDNVMKKRMWVAQRYVSQRYVSQRNEEEAKILYIIIKEHYLSFIVPKVAQFYFGLLFECSCFFTVHECSWKLFGNNGLRVILLYFQILYYRMKSPWAPVLYVVFTLFEQTFGMSFHFVQILFWK